MAIDVAQLTLRYGDRRAFSDVSLQIPRGEITAIVGPSGCGKTSFLNCLNRLTDLIPSAHVSGRVSVHGEDIHRRGADVVALRRRVGMIFQRPVPFPTSIRRNLELPLAEHDVPKPARGERTERALRDVGLWAEVEHRLDAPAATLSGGQQQRLCIARALVLAPDVLLLDEPCSALDPLASGVVEDLILSLRGRYTLVVVTHNLAQAKRIADHLAVFWTHDGAGGLIEAGPAKALWANPREPVTAAYLNGMRG